MAAVDDVPVLPPIEALRFFRQKGFAIGFAWQDIWQEEHARAFTVAKAMSVDLLEDIRAAVDAALAEGQTLAEFQKALRPTLERRGWWGKRSMVDPETGEQKIVQLGSPRRLTTIFDTNMRTAHAAGRWERAQRTKKSFPFLRYTSVMDGRERPQHHAWHGTIKPIDDAWWDTHYPPCGWKCRCTVTAINQRMMDRKGWSISNDPPAFPQRPYVNPRTGEVTNVEQGIDPGFSYNVGKAYLDGLTPSPLPDGGPIAAAEQGGTDDAITAFLGAFGIGSQARRIFTDAEGWPLAISSGWFRSPGGAFVAPGGASAEQLGRVGRAIVEPDSIAWRWVKDLSGRQVLMRRYMARVDGQAVLVDVGSIGWRFKLGSAEVAAAYNRHQGRDARGRFASGRGAGFVLHAMGGGAGQASLPIGIVSDRVKGRLSEMGINTASLKSVALDHGLVRHMMKRHASDHRGQKPLTADDIGRAHHILNNASRIIRGNPPHSKSGAARIYVAGKVGKDRFSGVFEVRKYRIVPMSLRKR